ncbi:DinB family protein [Streptomyces sp. NPDC021093]|uniref:DinB family protein n=1 Tax=Streptomyces sp. NPDC021093 TaxID=3365112 RepID=UPI00378E78AF
MVLHVSADNCTDEVSTLLAFLDEQRAGIRNALRGLTDEQAATTPSASELSLSGLLKHVTEVEQNWLAMAGCDIEPVQRSEADWDESFRLVPEKGETVASKLAEWAEVARRGAEFSRAADLDSKFSLPEAPWFPKEDVSLRWVLLRLITEMGRHAGHADIVRESLDGKNSYELGE